MKKQKEKKSQNPWVKLFRFFFPKDFKKEMARGMEMGKGSNVTKKLGEGLYGLGKATRKVVDPKHTMKIGDQKKKKGKKKSSKEKMTK